MKNLTRRNVFVYKANKGFLRTNLYQVDIDPETWKMGREHEVDKKELPKGLRIGFDKKTNEFVLKIDGKKFVTDGLYHVGENNDTHYFKDKRSGKFYFIKDGKISKPYANFLNVKSQDDYRLNDYDNMHYCVLDENGYVKDLSSALKETETNFKYISDSVLQNKNGKFAYSKDGEPQTDFIFDTKEIAKIGSRGDYDLYKDGNETLFITRNGKMVSEVEMIAEKIESFSVTNNGLGQILTTDGCIYIDMEIGKILYQSNAPADNSYRENNSFVSTNNGKSVYVEKQVVYEGIKSNVSYIINEIPYTACGLINGCIEAKDKNGKCGVVSKNGEVVLDFLYDDFGIKSNQNRTDWFLPIVLNGKMGVFNTLTREVEIEPFCKKVLLDQNDTVGRVSGDLFHFVFQDEKGKCGLVNNKGNILIEPVLEAEDVYSSMFSEDDRTYRLYTYRSRTSFDRERIYISTQSENIFPTTPELKYSSSEKQTVETKTRKKYDDSQVFAGTALSYVAFGPLGAMGAYDYLNSQSESKNITKTVKEETRDYVMRNIPIEFLQYVHSENPTSDSAMTIQEYQEKVQKMQQKELENKGKEKGE